MAVISLLLNCWLKWITRTGSGKYITSTSTTKKDKANYVFWERPCRFQREREVWCIIHTQRKWGKKEYSTLSFALFTRRKLLFYTLKLNVRRICALSYSYKANRLNVERWEYTESYFIRAWWTETGWVCISAKSLISFPEISKESGGKSLLQSKRTTDKLVFPRSAWSARSASLMATLICENISVPPYCCLIEPGRVFGGWNSVGTEQVDVMEVEERAVYTCGAEVKKHQLQKCQGDTNEEEQTFVCWGVMWRGQCLQGSLCNVYPVHRI